MDKRQIFREIAPRTVSDAAFLENTMQGAEVNVLALPAPIWHPKDGGPYIGSGSLVVMGDPDDGWVNASIYRVQVHDRNRVTIQFDHQGRHGAIISRKFWDKGKPCPVVVVNGEDPALFIAGFEYLPAGQSEYQFAAAIKGEPIDVFRGPITGLPIPAYAESVLEGYLLPVSETTLMEGPFGEFTGYYASEKRPCPVMDVKAVHYRNDPILLRFTSFEAAAVSFWASVSPASIWSNLIAAGVTDVVGVWQHVAQLMTVVALKQRYAGHVKRAASSLISK